MLVRLPDDGGFSWQFLLCTQVVGFCVTLNDCRYG
jgi:hypothetical protein